MCGGYGNGVRVCWWEGGGGGGSEELSSELPLIGLLHIKYFLKGFISLIISF